MSGVRPTLWIQRLSGVSHFETVSFTPPSSPSSSHSWTVPLPNDVSPMSVARSRSWSAPGDDLARRRATRDRSRTTTSIDGSVAMPPGAGVDLRLVAVRVLLPVDRAVRDELAGDVRGVRHEATRVAAQVEHDLLDPVVEVGLDRRLELRRALAREAGQAHVARPCRPPARARSPRGAGSWRARASRRTRPGAARGVRRGTSRTDGGDAPAPLGAGAGASKRWMWSVTSVPALPRTRSRASSGVRPSSVEPST